MKAAMFAHDVIKAGTNDIMVAGGMESMSNAPYILQGVRSGYRMGPGQAPQDHMFLDGLEDAETGRLMGAFAQEMADKKGYTREEMDEYAITSLTRAKRAIEEGLLKDEIIPVTVKTRKGEVVVEKHRKDPEPAPGLCQRRHGHRGQCLVNIGWSLCTGVDA
jgi:acetyl-CoA C-acetyltransferase